MNLLILPGGGNPDSSPLYAEVYDLIVRLAKLSGFQHVRADVRWPGQTTAARFAKSPCLTFPAAVMHAKRMMERMPPGPFAVLGRSYGCFVALKLGLEPAKLRRCPTKLILWGPTPHWLLWELFARDFVANRRMARAKGLKIDRQFFNSTEPVESLVQSVAIQTEVVAGTKDKYCSPAFLDYLRRVAVKNPLVNVPRAVRGAPHEVTEKCGVRVVRNYTKALFSEV